MFLCQIIVINRRQDTFLTRTFILGAFDFIHKFQSRFKLKPTQNRVVTTLATKLRRPLAHNKEPPTLSKTMRVFRGPTWARTRDHLIMSHEFIPHKLLYTRALNI
jgi:hypothetical protein